MLSWICGSLPGVEASDSHQCMYASKVEVLGLTYSRLRLSQQITAGIIITVEVGEFSAGTVALSRHFFVVGKKASLDRA